MFQPQQHCAKPLGSLLPVLKDLKAEANKYEQKKKQYIGAHGDLERSIVVAVRLGADMPYTISGFSGAALWARVSR